MNKINIGNLLLVLILLPIAPSLLSGGPPFVTDDPQPVDYKHWEFYVASQQSFTKNSSETTLPHVEVNYGILPEVQLHKILPMEYSNNTLNSNYRFSNTELGIKYRFVDETDSNPQIGAFPLVILPTEKNSGDGGKKITQAFFPLWIQKSWSKLTTYGGGGYWINPGVNNKNWLLIGWEAQYDFSNALTFGGELFYQSAQTKDSETSLCFNLGGYVNFDNRNHLLFSMGHTVHGENTITGYIAYQLTI